MSISSTGLYGSATIVATDLFQDVSDLKDTYIIHTYIHVCVCVCVVCVCGERERARVRVRVSECVCVCVCRSPHSC